MSKLKMNQLGFSIVEALLLLVVVGILGFTGWFVVHSKHTADKNLSGNTSTLPKIQKTKTTTTLSTNETQKAEQQTLDITEWGVHVTLDSGTTSLYYYISPDLPDVAYFGLRAIDNIAPNSDCAADKDSVGAIARLTEAQQEAATANPSALNQPGTIHIGNYWYNAQNSHAACADPSDEAKISKALAGYNVGELENVLNTLAAD